MPRLTVRWRRQWWMPDGYLYFIFLPNAAPPGRALTPSLWGGETGRQRAAGAVEAVWRVALASYGALTRLPDGRLGLVRTCRPGGTALLVDDLVALDTKTRVESVLARFPELTAINLYDWKPGLAGGFVSDETAECAAIWPVVHGAPGQFPMPVTIDAHSWRPDQGMGQAFRPGDRFMPVAAVQRDHREGCALEIELPVVAGWSVLRLRQD